MKLSLYWGGGRYPEGVDGLFTPYRIYSNNVLERLHKEVRRRTNVVGVFPDEASVIRLVGAILQEQDDEWEVMKRYFSLESMHRVYHPQLLITAEVIPFTLAPVH
jgi:putative transposase